MKKTDQLKERNKADIIVVEENMHLHLHLTQKAP